MSVLVTGGAGYIGSHLVLHLLDAGRKVVVLDNLRSGFREAVPPGARLVEGDLGDRRLVDDILAREKIEAIFHFGASLVVPESVADPLGYYLNNTVKSRELIAAAVAAGTPRIVFSSTAAVYGMTGSEPVAETTSPAPLSPYGRSKLMVETMLADTATAHGLRYVALRYFNVAGADPRGRAGQRTHGATHLIKVAVEAALGKRGHVDVYGNDYPTPDGTGVRDYIHVSDLVAAHADALAYLVGGGTSFVGNCGYGRGFSVLEVLNTVKRISGTDFEVRLAPRRAGDPASVVAANGLVKEKLGWQARHDDLDEIVTHALAWERRLG